MSSQNFTRRDFLKIMAITPAFFGLLSSVKGCGTRKGVPPRICKIVRVTNADATDNTGGKDNQNLIDSVVREMVDNGIKTFTDKATVKEAWSEIIPDPKKKVAIKVNCQIKGIFTKAEVVKAVTDGLILRGVSPSNIVIYDLTDHAFSYAGFEKNTSSGIKVGTNSELGGYSWISWFGIPLPYIGNRFCKVIAGEGKYGCDYLINIPVLKALDGYSGVSISMKNHFGSIAGCSELHSNIQNSIAALNAHELILRKTRLILVDAIFTEYKWFNGRNQDAVDITNQLLFAVDPVATDYIGWQMIENLRKNHSMNPVNPKPSYIHKAAVDYALGTDELKNIDLIDI